MVSEPSVASNLRSITHLANFPSPNQPTSFSDEPLFSSLGMLGHELADFGLWKISLSGGKPEPLAAFGQSVRGVAVSPKGDRLAYARVPQSNHNIYEINLACSVGRKDLPRTVISSTEEDYSPRFSPDGTKIALVSARSGSLEIWICASDGGSCSPATAFGDVGSPKWSPDGRQIAFDSIKYGQWDIFVADLERSATHRLTYGSSNAARPGWSVDGQWIYFASDRTGEWQVWKMPSKGGPAVQVTREGGFEAEEGLDGKFVYYAKRGSKGIWRIPVAGGVETQLLDKGAEAQWFLARKGIYLLESEQVRGYMLRYIEVYSFATGGVSRVADLPATAAGVAHNDWIPALTVSPDGRRALFSQMDHAESEIMLVENFR
jgi:WD40-like Beta Propeller Repeat